MADFNERKIITERTVEDGYNVIIGKDVTDPNNPLIIHRRVCYDDGTPRDDTYYTYKDNGNVIEEHLSYRNYRHGTCELDRYIHEVDPNNDGYIVGETSYNSSAGFSGIPDETEHVRSLNNAVNDSTTLRYERFQDEKTGLWVIRKHDLEGNLYCEIVTDDVGERDREEPDTHLQYRIYVHYY